MNLNKGIFQHLAAITVLLVVAAVYFYPELQGKKILAHDSMSAVSASKQARDYQEKGETILWGNTVFSGMPLYQVAYSVKANLLKVFFELKQVLPLSIWIWFTLMLGFYISLSLLGYRSEIGVIGAITFGLSTWFLLSIEAGHATKILAIAFIPPLISSILITYKGKWLLGGILTSLFLGLAIMANHPQIVYYSIFLIGLLFIVKLVGAIKEKKLPVFIKRSLILIGFGLLGVLPNITLLWTTYDYSHETMRGGKSELINENQKKSTGLEIDYAMAWSYGKAESFNFLIPGLYAPGATLGKNSDTYEELVKKGVPKNQVIDYLKGIPMYYGTQTTPSGPSYMGAGLLFLFVLMLFIYKGNFKWILTGTILISLIFSWGSNFLVVNEFFFNHFPLYNKFRTPSMWLSLMMIAVSFGAMMALKVISEKEYDTKKIKKALLYTGGILGGIALIVFLMGSSFLDFVGPYDTQLEQNGLPIDSIVQDRIDLTRNDALRTLFILALVFGIVWAIVFNKIKNIKLGIIALGVILIGDLWLVGKRFLNEDDFTKAKTYEKSIVATAADQQILTDKAPNYRVFNASVSSFNDNNSSYFHHSVGGYSAAKLYRYQDIIERHLAKGNMNVFNMLNTKYFITGKPGQEMAQQNPGALGSVWFVNEINWAKNANEEMEKLTNFNPLTTVVIDERYKNYLQSFNFENDSTGNIALVNFNPDKMTYSSEANVYKFAVFSEIWYKGNIDWKAFIDGKEAEFIRVNYLLRGLKIPKGKHEIIFKFHPDSHYIGSKISLVSSGLILVMILGLVLLIILKKPLPGMKED